IAPSESRWGCALTRDGAPKVAQRSWTIPRRPAISANPSSAATSSIFPAFFRRSMTPSPRITAQPTESYPRYDSLRPASTRMSPRGRSRSTTMPKMPHMRSPPVARRLLPPSPEGPVQRDDRVELVALRPCERVLRGEELLLGIDDLEVRREPGQVPDVGE